MSDLKSDLNSDHDDMTAYSTDTLTMSPPSFTTRVTTFMPSVQYALIVMKYRMKIKRNYSYMNAIKTLLFLN